MMEQERNGGRTKRAVAVSRTAIFSPKLTAPVRIAVLTDLHNCRFGPRQEALLAAVAAEEPDMIGLVGDIFDVRENERHTRDALDALAKRYPCYYVTGNHERANGREKQIRAAVRSSGATLLGGTVREARFNGQRLLLCGLDDAADQSPDWSRQLQTLANGLEKTAYSVLLSHRPERFAEFLAYGFDLMLSGHTHGGQWRLPFIRNGVYAPGQGLFPKYAGGRFDRNGQTLIVSRGLSKKPYLLPRIGNPPELVVVTLLPEALSSDRPL